MGFADAAETDAMKCSIAGCPGEYEQRPITHAVRSHGRLVVIDHVPADVCGACGDTLLAPETVGRLERLLDNLGAPISTVPLFEYA